MMRSNDEVTQNAKSSIIFKSGLWNEKQARKGLSNLELERSEPVHENQFRTQTSESPLYFPNNEELQLNVTYARRMITQKSHVTNQNWNSQSS